jgi:putative DNA primase/helicase
VTAASPMARFAERYCEIGLALTWTPPGEKGPRHTGWNRVENAVTTPAAARHYWSENTAHGIAALLGPSNLVSLDVDDEERSHVVLRHFNIGLDELRRTAPCILGRHFRLVYRAPDVELKHRTMVWPKQVNPGASAVILEMRAGSISDTLPPTMHPGTGQPYRWENPPRDGFPPLPNALLDLWLDWSATSRAALALCPWAPAPKETPPARPRTSASPRESVIAAFNAAHDVAAILQAHGYLQRGKRFLSPESGHAAGIVLMEGGKAFCHHAGDLLSGEHCLDAFDVYRLLQHRGDYRSAVSAAARALNLDHRTLDGGRPALANAQSQIHQR